MTLKNALNHFERLASETNNKSELKIYHEFIQIISNLRQKELSATEIQSIEAALDELDLSAGTSNYKRYHIKALRHFKTYLKDTFSFTTKSYFTETGIAFGSGFGIVFGNILIPGTEGSMGIALGLALGTAIGLIIGGYLDAQAKASGKMV